MSLFTRFAQKLFGSSAGANRIGEFGSLAAGSPVAFSGATATPANIQTLSNYDEGLDGSLVAGSTTPIQDLNALHFLSTYQLGYLFQQGVAEWDADTAYNSNSLAMSGTTVYQSTETPNLNNDPTLGSPWQIFATAPQAPQITVFTSGSGTYAVPAGTRYLGFEAVGGGGGGGCSNTTGAGNSATNGSSTVFGSGICLGGLAGLSGDGVNIDGGSGGAGSGFSGFSFLSGIAVLGGWGSAGGAADVGASVGAAGGIGGTSALGGSGGGGRGTKSGTNNAGRVGRANTGGGGGGGGAVVTSSLVPSVAGGGGGAGGYVKGIILSPASTYAYSVGVGGVGDAGGSAVGGAGGSGVIKIVAYF